MIKINKEAGHHWHLNDATNNAERQKLNIVLILEVMYSFGFQYLNFFEKILTIKSGHH